MKEDQVKLKQSVELEESAPLTEPERFPMVDDNYKIVALIGHGGMGTVYKAINLVTNSTVAIKLFSSSVAKDKETLKRFEQEARALSNLDDSELLTIHDSGMSPDGAPYLVMDYIEGDNLAEILKREKIDIPRAFSLFSQLCELLNRAHRRGIIHRDIKPSNILISKQQSELDTATPVVERVRIVDFGIARIVDSVHGDTTNLTHTGAVFGTPTYMSPEQCKAHQAVDQRSDIYSLGCVMYEVLTGHPPFVGDNPIQVAMQHLNDAPKPFKTKDFSKDLELVVLQCLAKDPKNRYQSVEELSKDLELVRQNHHPKHLKRPKSDKTRHLSGTEIWFVLLLTTLVGALVYGLTVQESLFISHRPSVVGTAAKSSKAANEVRQLTAEIKLHPEDKFWYMKRAQAYSDLKRETDAIADYSKVIKLDPQDVHAYTNRGSSYAGLRKWNLSMSDENKALSLSPNHVNAICTRAIIFMETEDYSSALKECERAIQLDPARVDAYLTRGRVYMRTDQLKSALREFDTVINMAPHLTAGYWNRSQCHLALKNFTRSITDATTAIDLDPSDPYLYTNRASIYLDLAQ